MPHDIKIVTEGALAHIFIDGVEVRGVTGYSIRHNTGPDRIPVLSLDVIGNMEISGLMLTPIPEPWSRFYMERIVHDGDSDDIVESACKGVHSATQDAKNTPVPTQPEAI